MLFVARARLFIRFTSPRVQSFALTRTSSCQLGVHIIAQIVQRDFSCTDSNCAFLDQSRVIVARKGKKWLISHLTTLTTCKQQSRDPGL